MPLHHKALIREKSESIPTIATLLFSRAKSTSSNGNVIRHGGCGILYLGREIEKKITVAILFIPYLLL